MNTETSSLLMSVYRSDCTRCDLHRGANTVCVKGRGGFGYKILFVAEAPGKQEDLKGRTLVGEAGRIFDKALGAIGMTEDDFYCTNIVKCRPPGNRTPTKDEVAACKRYLYKEIDLLQPAIIVLLGASAIKAFFGSKATLKSFRGRISEWQGFSVFATYHPSAVNYDPHILSLIHADLNILVNHLNGAEPEKVDYLYSVSNKKILKEIDDYTDGKVLSLDLETTGLDMYRPDFRVISAAISKQSKEAIGILLDHKKAMTDHQPYMEEILRVLKGKTLVGHNFKYDLLCLRALGKFLPNKIYDTMVMAHLLDENSPDKSLENLALQFTTMGNIKADTKEAFSKGQQEEIPPELLLLRNCRDADSTLRLYYHFMEIIHREDMFPLLEFQMEVVNMLTDIEWEGWSIDAKNFKVLKVTYEQNLKELMENIEERIGYSINLNSPKQKVQLLYRELKFPVIERSEKTNEPSTARDVLKRLLWEANKHQKKTLTMIMDWMMLYKRYTFFAQVKRNLKADMKIHPNYRQTKGEISEDDEGGGTITGRLSCKNPNVQQIPREGDIKRIFRSKWKRGRIVQIDYSQMELRVLAEISRDRKMINIFKDDKVDIHRRVASWPGVYNKPESQVTDKERKFTKQVNFGIAYMIGPKGLSKKLSEVAGHIVTKEEAKRLIEGWFDEFPMVDSWIRDTRRILIREMEVVNLMGRKRRLAETNPSTAKGREGIRQGVNFCIQSLASDITLYRAVEYWKWLRKEELDTRIVGLVHDAVILDCPEPEVDTVVPMIFDIFEDNDFSQDFGFEMTVPLKVEVKMGRTWGELSEVDRG